MRFLRLLPLILALLLLPGCLRQTGQGRRARTLSPEASRPGAAGPQEAGALNPGAAPNPAWPALALLKAGDNPLWFELGPGGPELIDSPGSASLTPYTPWPHARFISGILHWEDYIVMAVNRDGFLILGPEPNGEAEPGNSSLLMYRAADSAFWDPYTTESLFIWEDRPAVLLYRNDFFTHELPLAPGNQVFVLDKTSPLPLASRIPALEIGDPWEAEMLRQGADGLWYYRMREKDIDQAESAFFRTDDLSRPGLRISDEEWRQSFLPDSFLPEGPEPEEPGGPADSEPWLSSLPELPEDFVYTAMALLGNVLIASWEEEQLPAIGAAGFMVILHEY